MKLEATSLLSMPPLVPLPEERCQVQPLLENNPHLLLVVDASGLFVPEFNMFVDDLLTAAPRENGNRLRVFSSSIEAVYLILGRPGAIASPALPSAMADNKMTDRPVSPRRVSLGIEFDAVCLVISTKAFKAQEVHHFLTTTWSAGWKLFTAREAAVLIGNVVYYSRVCGWLCWSLYHLLDALITLLRCNQNRLRRKYGEQLSGWNGFIDQLTPAVLTQKLIHDI